MPLIHAELSADERNVQSATLVPKEIKQMVCGAFRG